MIANLAPVYGVLYLEWKVFPIILLFWTENVIIGLFSVFKMLLSDLRVPFKWLVKVFAIPFFCFHYGMFTAIHGVFVLLLFSGAEPKGSNVDIFYSFILYILEYRLGYAVIILMLSHAFSFSYNYVLKGEYRTSKLHELIGGPYSRVLVLHFTLLFGGFLLMFLGAPIAGLLLLILLKIVVDINAHVREHKSSLNLH